MWIAPTDPAGDITRVSYPSPPPQTYKLPDGYPYDLPYLHLPMFQMMYTLVLGGRSTEVS